MWCYIVWVNFNYILTIDNHQRIVFCRFVATYISVDDLDNKTYSIR